MTNRTTTRSRFRPAPAIFSCRSIKNIRACLSYYNNLEDEDAILDFRKVGFVDCGALVLLHLHAQRKRNIVVAPPTTGARRFFADHLKPLRAFADQAATAFLQEFTTSRLPTTYPLRYVPRENMAYKELSKWREMLIRTTNIGEERGRLFSQTMSEILTNSFVHGKTRTPCIIAGQTFPKKKHSILVAADSGRTIPLSLSRSKAYRGHYLSDEGWIKLALDRGVSAKTRRSNMGLGLFMLKEQVLENRGKMTIVSRKGAVTVDGERNSVKPEPLGVKYGSFPGTLIILDLQTH